MKLFLTLLVLLSSFFLFAEEIKVKKMSQDGDLERSYVLKTNLTEVVVLDCQSFIQGLRIGAHEQAVFFMLDPVECEALQDRVRGSLKHRQLHCIDVDQEIRSDYSCQ
jgi:hypothetical protein